MIRPLALCALMLFMAGCASQGTRVNLNAITVGMTKPEVIDAMGSPHSTSAADGVEYMLYTLTEGTDSSTAAACGGAGVLTLGLIYLADECRNGLRDDYFVRLTGGRVDAYGRVGDFDSTNPERVKIDATVRQQ